MYIENSGAITSPGPDCIAIWKKRLPVMAALWLVACAPQSVQHPAADSAGRMSGSGFSIASPPDPNWTVSMHSPDAIVFRKNVRIAEYSSEIDGFYRLSAGVTTLTSDTLINKSEADFVQGVRLLLSERLRVPGRTLLSLNVNTAQLQAATCAEYRGVQADQYDPEKIVSRYEFVQHGFLCRHPSSPTLLIQVFYTEQFLRSSPPIERVNPAAMQAFFRQLQFVIPA